MYKRLFYALFVFTFQLSVPLQAKTLDVNNQIVCSDKMGNPYCQIGAALQAANADDTIKIASGKYVESLVIDKNIKLFGAAPSSTIIDAAGKKRVVTVRPGTRVQIKSMTLQGGKANKGAGILNSGSLMLSHVRVFDNVAELSGGGIYNVSSVSGSLYIRHSIIEHNKSLGNDKHNIRYGGGGIFNNAPLIIEDSQIKFNQAEDNGGGIYSVFSGRFKFSEGEIVAEKLGISAATERQQTMNRKFDIGAVSIKRSQILNNHADAGGGINVHGVLDISQSILSENSATNGKRSSGGGLFTHFDTALNLSNVLVSYNRATFRGGGIRFYTVGFGKFFNVSIIDNQVLKKFGQGAGLFVIRGKDKLEISNSLIARNFIQSQTISDCHGKIRSLGNNYLSHVKNCIGFDSATDIFKPLGGVDYLYQWDEGQSRYKAHALGGYVEHGNSVNCTGVKGKRLSRDVYGKPRHLAASGGGVGRCDIGAIEFEESLPQKGDRP